MSKPEDEKIDFEKFTLSKDLSDSLEPLPEDMASLPSSDEAPEDDIQPEDLLEEQKEEFEQAESDVESEAGEETEAMSEETKAPSTSKFGGLWDKLSVANPFTVMLAVSVAALLIAILCCLIELGRYGFDFGAKGARQASLMNNPVASARDII